MKDDETPSGAKMQAECHLKNRKTNKEDEKSAKVTEVSDVTVDTHVGVLILQQLTFFVTKISYEGTNTRNVIFVI